jgi:hypothetical protein
MALRLEELSESFFEVDYEMCVHGSAARWESVGEFFAETFI